MESRRQLSRSTAGGHVNERTHYPVATSTSASINHQTPKESIETFYDISSTKYYKEEGSHYLQLIEESIESASDSIRTMLLSVRNQLIQNLYLTDKQKAAIENIHKYAQKRKSSDKFTYVNGPAGTKIKLEPIKEEKLAEIQSNL